MKNREHKRDGKLSEDRRSIVSEADKMHLESKKVGVNTRIKRRDLI